MALKDGYITRLKVENADLRRQLTSLLESKLASKDDLTLAKDTIKAQRSRIDKLETEYSQLYQRYAV